MLAFRDVMPGTVPVAQTPTAYPDLASRLDGADPMPQIFIKPLDHAALVGELRSLPRAA